MKDALKVFGSVVFLCLVFGMVANSCAIKKPTMQRNDEQRGGMQRCDPVKHPAPAKPEAKNTVYIQVCGREML